MPSNEQPRAVPRKSEMNSAPPTLSEPINIVSIEESIRLRAYQLYEERGRIDGHDEEDWAQAEMEILSQQAGKAAA